MPEPKTPQTGLLADAMRTIDKAFAKHNMDVLLCYERNDERDEEYVITLTICTKKNSDHPPGTIEYNVCDGPPGLRSESADFFDLDEALKFYKSIVKMGWKAYYAKCRKRAGIS